MQTVKSRGASGTSWKIVACLLLGAAPTFADPSPALPPEADDSVSILAEKIDAALAARWAQEQVTPAAAAGDAEFLRRVSLDIAGKIPPVAELRHFLADPSPHKRREVVERLLESPAYITHFTNVWRNVMMPEANTDFQVRTLLPNLEAWLRDRLSNNSSYAAMVREILTTPLTGNNRPSGGMPGDNSLSPVVFYQAKQLKPENLAASTARIFLGVRIECAQCHDHPFDTWKREQFWSYAAFFAGIERQQQPAEGFFAAVQELLDRRKLTIPGTERVVQPLFLDGSQPVFQQTTGSRQLLADWMMSAENPYFARAAVNRMWEHFFGIGLVDPVDDFTGENLPSHPELLAELARQFIAHDYDLKYLIRVLTATKAYQLTSAVSHNTQQNPRLFARMAVKALTPEQLFDSLAQATGYYELNRAQVFDPFAANSVRSEFLEAFANSTDSRTEQQTTILQALALMNGQFIADATSLEKSTTLAAVADFPLMTTPERVEALYLATLVRPPRPAELERMVQYVEAGGPAKDSKRALGDLFWALLNSSEFLLNH